MKKFFYLASAALLLASCSNEAAEVVDNNVPTPTPEEELSYPAEQIQLGTNARVSAGTRALVLDQWDGQTIGVMALCSEATLLSGETWETVATVGASQAATDNQPGLLKGVKATVAAPVGTDPSVVSFTTPSQGEALPTPPFYYPRTSTRNYRFYGYYPYATPQWDTDKKTYSVSGDFDGQTDIVAGVSDLVTNGWNAKYIRGIKDAQEQYTKPNIVFKHLTAQFQILLKAGMAYDPSETSCQIDSLSIDLPVSYDLVVATQAGAGTAQEVMPALTISGDSVNVPIVKSGVTPTVNGTNQVGNKLSSDNMIIAWNATDDAATLGAKTNPYNDAIFVPASNDPQQVYTLYVTFKNGVTSPVEFKYGDVKQGSQSDGTEDRFTAGKAYYIVLTVNGPEKILLTATLTPWVNNGEFDLEL